MNKKSKSLAELTKELNEQARKEGTGISEEELKEIWPKDSVSIELTNFGRPSQEEKPKKQKKEQKSSQEKKSAQIIEELKKKGWIYGNEEPNAPKGFSF